LRTILHHDDTTVTTNGVEIGRQSRPFVVLVVPSW